MIVRFLLGFALFTVCFVGLIVILAALFLIFVSYSPLCEMVIEKVERAINKIRRRQQKPWM